ncbi:restriction endonuclease subunit S domain-containing protein [Flavobacterium agrisoli]|uniref:Type I restriction modification DNA specificity protein n=1 Tax=Flavobacterium agrisoli TaxID=2793066 RepID=A0A934PPC9_9FLAO|nr:hypothetical protein [Flavobacterium agrisoli]MBK0370176.1 hypothetical protein [Flavobacterium agrisoli]
MKLLEKHFEIALETPDGITRLRELILKLAMQGKLVPQNLKEQPAHELLEEIEKEKEKLINNKLIKKQSPLSKLTNNEIPFSIPENWKWVKLNTFLDVRDGTHDTPKYVDSGFPLITSKNLYSGKLTFDNVKHISELDHYKISERSKVDKEDILFAMIGSIGNPVLVDTDVDFSIKNVALIKYFNKKKNTMFILYFII